MEDIIEHLKQQIIYRKVEIDELNNKRMVLENEIKNLYTEIEFNKTGLAPDMIVRRRDGSKGVLVSFSQYAGWDWFKLKKDGTPMKSRTHVGNNITRVTEREGK
jgi:hypothetical protein